MNQLTVFECVKLDDGDMGRDGTHLVDLDQYRVFRLCKIDLVFRTDKLGNLLDD